MLILSRATLTEEVIQTTDAGEVQGYAATWTYQGDGMRFEPGCFKKTTAERAGKIPLLVKHAQNGGDVLETVGWIVSGTEDEKGLWIKASFLDTELGQRVREQVKAGGISSFSVGVNLIKTRTASDIIVVTEAKLMEVTLTNIPADIEAEIYTAREEAQPSTVESTPEVIAQEPDTSAQDTDAFIRARAELTNHIF